MQENQSKNIPHDELERMKNNYEIMKKIIDKSSL